MHQRTTSAALAVVGILLVASMLAGGSLITTPAFAYTISSSTTVGQHIPNSEAGSIKSIDFKMDKASLLTSDTLTIQIKQDDKVIGSTSIDARILTTAYQTITATFTHPVNVTADKYDIEVSYNGKGLVSVLERPDYIPGNSYDADGQYEDYDLIIDII